RARRGARCGAHQVAAPDSADGPRLTTVPSVLRLHARAGPAAPDPRRQRAHAPSHQQALGDPQRLVPALEMGLTVIAAHAGTRGGLLADPFPQEMAQLCARYPRLFLDCSAFASPARLHAMRQMWVIPRLRERFVYGSDFPVPLLFPLFWRRSDPELLARARAT